MITRRQAVLGSIGLFVGLRQEKASYASGDVIVGSDVVLAATRKVMARMDPSKGRIARLLESGREGLFMWESSDLSSAVRNDSVQARHVAPLADATGSSGAWVRLYEHVANVRWFGAVGDGISDDLSAFQAAASTGDLVFIPDGTYALSDYVTLADGSQFFGSRKAVLKSTGEDKALFYAANLTHFSLRGFTLEGNISSPGTPALVRNRSAVAVITVADCLIENCHFEQWHGSGVTFSREGTGASGTVRNCEFVKGDMTATGSAWGIQDCAPVQVYQRGHDITVEGNSISGKWYHGFIAQDQVNDGASRIRGLRVVGNMIRDVSQYGITAYTLVGPAIREIASNGSGQFRVTTFAAHNLTDGDRVHLQLCGDASGIWEVDVISATTFDLASSTYSASVSSGEFRMSENCAGQFSDNLIDGVDGDRAINDAADTRFGAGFYVQGVGGIHAENNVIRRTHLLSNSANETLSPGGIGINGATGPCTFLGGGIYDAQRHGLSIKTKNTFGRVTIGGGMNIVRARGQIADMHVPRFVTLRGIAVETRADAIDSRILIRDLTHRGRDVRIEDITCSTFNVTNSSNILEANKIDGLVIKNVSLTNVKPAAQQCEVARVIDCTRAQVTGNNFDGGHSAYTALDINGTTHSHFLGNRVRMQDDGNARAIVRMTNTCTGSVFYDDNDVLRTDLTEGRPENVSTGGQMHTRAAGNTSGGKTRQVGDTITNSAYAGVGVWRWIKRVAGPGRFGWSAITLGDM